MATTPFDGVVESFTILADAAGLDMTKIHYHQPVILPATTGLAGPPLTQPIYFAPTLPGGSITAARGNMGV